MGALFYSRGRCVSWGFKVFIDLGVFEAKKCWRSIKRLCKLYVMILHRQNVPREPVPLALPSLVFLQQILGFVFILVYGSQEG